MKVKKDERLTEDLKVFSFLRIDSMYVAILCDLIGYNDNKK
jgi:hypothetical protein